jgi:integrase
VLRTRRRTFRTILVDDDHVGKRLHDFIRPFVFFCFGKMKRDGRFAAMDVVREGYVVLDHIGRGETGRAKHEENVVKRLMERVCRKAGLPESGWHRLRHSYGTHAAMFGVNPWRLMTWMGHKRVDETMLYVHLAQQHRREIPQPVLKSGARELDPDLRILAMLGERHSAWQPRGSRNEETHENRLVLVG